MKKIIALNIVWLLIIALYTVLISTTLISNKISTLFHPRNYPFFLSALFLLLLMIYRQCCNLINPDKYLNFNYSLFIFFIPLISSASVLMFSQNSITSLVRNQNSIYPSSQSGEKEFELTSLDEIIVTDDNYYEIYNKIFDNLECLAGKKIEVSGYIFREKKFKQTEFIVARDLMWCCAADIALIGFYCDVDNPDYFKVNDWIKVFGVLDKHMYHNEDLNKDYYIASIKIESVEKINPPVNEYIYPSFTGF